VVYRYGSYETILQKMVCNTAEFLHNREIGVTVISRLLWHVIQVNKALKAIGRNNGRFSSQPLVKKPRVVSVVWNYFGLRTEGGRVVHEDKPVCRACLREVPAKGGNTSNLMAHLREHHADLHMEAMGINHQQQVSGSCSGRRTTKRGSNNNTNGLTNGGQSSRTTVTELFEASRKLCCILSFQRCPTLLHC